MIYLDAMIGQLAKSEKLNLLQEPKKRIWSKYTKEDCAKRKKC